ncbi:MAG: ABC transporter permease, partial [Chloroflexi bacterium]|nr:ABC transporter permease [Chloroflexota bacterium]
AAKNLMRRRVRTSLTITGVAIAIAVLFSLLAFNAGYEKQLSGELGSMGINMLAVPKGCPYEAASLIIHGGVIPKYLSYDDLEKVRNIDGVEIASPMLLHQFFKDDKPHIVYGINIDDQKQLKPWWKVEGRYFTEGESGVMVVGRSLAEKEDLKVGQVLQFGPTGVPTTIVGILERTGTQDDEFHFLPLADSQKIFGKEGQITTIAVKVKDVSQISAIGKKMEQIPDIQVVTMTQIQGTIMNLVGSAQTLLFSVIIIALFISAVGIMNTLIMSVNERTREFGMMKAVGASGWDVSGLIVMETLILTLIGCAVGLIVALAGSKLVESFVRGVIPYAPAGNLIVVEPWLVFACIGFALVIGLLCSIYPAIKSARLTPMEAMRSDLE